MPHKKAHRAFALWLVVLLIMAMMPINMVSADEIYVVDLLNDSEAAPYYSANDEGDSDTVNDDEDQGADTAEIPFGPPVFIEVPPLLSSEEEWPSIDPSETPTAPPMLTEGPPMPLPEEAEWPPIGPSEMLPDTEVPLPSGVEGETEGATPENRLAGYVWQDDNEDGYSGDDEQPISGLDIYLLEVGGYGVLESSRTGDDGRYAFEQVQPGAYVISVGELVGYRLPTQSAPQSGDNRLTEMGRTERIEIELDSDMDDLHIGLLPPLDDLTMAGVL